jgi:hypothetical protein
MGEVGEGRQPSSHAGVGTVPVGTVPVGTVPVGTVGVGSAAVGQRRRLVGIPAAVVTGDSG